MKSVYITLTALLLLTSCSKDDGGPGTHENQSPEAFELISVAHNSTDVDKKPQFEWEPAIDPDGDEVTYSLFMGKDPYDLAKIASGLTETTFTPENSLSLLTTFYWKVSARDGQGGTTESEINAFTTRKLNNAMQATASAGFNASTEIHTAVFDGKLWIIGGNVGNTVYDEVWYTTNGISWTEAPDLPHPKYYHQVLTYNGKMWVLFGHDGTSVADAVLSSGDGLTWNIEGNSSSLQRYDHSALVFDGKMWIIGGTSGSSESDYKNDVWYSTDGITWTEATPNAAFTPRRGHTSVVYDGKMWVIGGQDGNSLQNDAWYSSDGINWTEASQSGTTVFLSKIQHVSETYAGKMWVISGDENGGETNDVWSTTDGTNWVNVYADAAFTPRRYAASAVFDDKLWIIGGYDNVNGYVTDVWYME